MIDRVKIVFVWQKRNQFLEGNLVRKIDQYMIARLNLCFFFIVLAHFTLHTIDLHRFWFTNTFV